MLNSVYDSLVAVFKLASFGLLESRTFMTVMSPDEIRICCRHYVVGNYAQQTLITASLLLRTIDILSQTSNPCFLR